MTCAHFQESFIEAHDGTLPPAAEAALRAHLAACPSCQREWLRSTETLALLGRLPAPEPSPQLRPAFQAALAAAIAAEATGNPAADRAATASAAPVRPTRASDGVAARLRHAWEILNRGLGALLPTQPAFQAAGAVALLCVGLLVGTRYAPSAASPAGTASPAADEATRRELASLRDQVSSMSQLVAYSLAQQQQPVGTRLQNVSLTRRSAAQSASPATLAVLINSLAFDASTNVRLSALEALYEHADQPLARQAVLTALPRERSPLVQLAMIDFLASLGDAAAAPTLEALVREAATDADVRTAAQRVLATYAP